MITVIMESKLEKEKSKDREEERLGSWMAGILYIKTSLEVDVRYQDIRWDNTSLVIEIKTFSARSYWPVQNFLWLALYLNNIFTFWALNQYNFLKKISNTL